MCSTLAPAISLSAATTLATQSVVRQAKHRESRDSTIGDDGTQNLESIGAKIVAGQV
jgi:hypothetical protein